MRSAGSSREVGAARCAAAAIQVALVLALAPDPLSAEPIPEGSGSPPGPARFVDAAAALGVSFVHRNFATGEWYMPENTGSGAAIFDYDGDGLLDLYLVQGAPIGPAAETGGPAGPEAANRLFRQRLDGLFEDVTLRAGVGDTGYGMGAAFGDYDLDGDPDLYVTNFGANVLYRNRGDGTFEDFTAAAGSACDLWSVGAGFFDADGDGDLDLYVANYLDFSFANHKWCGSAVRGIQTYCHPEAYDALPDCLFRNQGDGTFVEASRESGILPTPDGVGLGVAFADLDGDGSQDVYVANDATMNYLYLNDGTGRFRESALAAGVGFDGQGQPESSMGVEIGDLDGDGLPDIFLTHLDRQTNTLYRNLGRGVFVDATEAAGLAAPSLPWVGFGTVFLDHDNDGDLDVFVANGHILDNIARFDPARSHRQPCQLYDNLGDGRFVEVPGFLEPAEPRVGRGAAGGDLDRDGAVDLVVTQNNGAAAVFFNRLGRDAGWLAARLAGRGGSSAGFGARLELTIARLGSSRRQVRLLHGATSFASQGAPQVHFGLGAAGEAERLEVRWPSGRAARYGPLPAGRLYTLIEPEAGSSPRPREVSRRSPDRRSGEKTRPDQ